MTATPIGGPMMPRIAISTSLAILLLLSGCTTPGEQAQLQWSEHSELGTILTDGEGYTLYLFTNDEGGSSSCYDQCATNWPPLLTQGTPVVDADVDGDIGTTQRTDGTTQVTYDGDPLYHFHNDDAPGDANGQGVGDVWFVIEMA